MVRALVATAAVLLLNFSVAAVKLGLGRLGPHYATVLGSNELFGGGDIFPSGHTSNAVVTWGVLAYLAVRNRRTAVTLAAALAVSVGLTTLYLGTHWVSDVLAGWAAGSLVLLALPVLEPITGLLERRLLDLPLTQRLLGPLESVPLPCPKTEDSQSPYAQGSPSRRQPTPTSARGA